MTSAHLLVSNRVNNVAKDIVDITPFIKESPWSGEYAVFNMMLYSEPGEGKTPLLATVVDVPEMLPALLIDCDNGTLSARFAKTLKTIHISQMAQEKGISPWNALELIYGWLLFAPHDFKTVFVDGGTDLQRYCELDCIAQGVKNKTSDGKEHDPELAELADYRRIQERMKRLYIRFRDITTKDGRRMNFVATAHESKGLDPKTSKPVIQPMFIGKLAPMAMSAFDIIARLTTEERTEKGKTVLVKRLVPCLEGNARGRDRSFALGEVMEAPSMRKIYECIHNMKR